MGWIVLQNIFTSYVRAEIHGNDLFAKVRTLGSYLF